MKPRISTVSLATHNLVAATAFYEKLFGITKMDYDKVSFFELNGTCLALYPREVLAEDATVSPSGSGFSGFALAHVVKTQQEVDQTLSFAEQLGGKIIKPAQAEEWGGYAGYFADLDGHLWEITSYPGDAWLGPRDPEE